jgi:hypothetical protein
MPIDTTQPTIQEIGNYEIVSKIADGGMGTVWKARRKTDGLIVAIKIIPTTAARNPVLLQRFKREFEVARQLDHPNIVKAIEYCGNVATPFLVMEYVDGESIGQRIERAGKMAEEEAKNVMIQVCDGLYTAHNSNLIHRDVKPDNILLTPDGVAKLTDLGLVKDLEGELNLTRTGRGLGTPHFMAPEQFRNAKNADIRCDVYSLGATLYMMVTGKMPFDGCGPLDAWMKKSSNEFPAPRELQPAISERMDWAIRRSMSASPDARPANCREFIEDVTGATSRPAAAAPTSQDLWYMVYKDDDGTVHTVKGTTENIRRAYREGLLGDAANIRAARTKQGPFQALRGHPEFRDLVAGPEVPAVPGQPTTNGPVPPAPGSGQREKVVPASGQSDPLRDETVPYPAVAATHRWTAGQTSFPSPSGGKFHAQPSNQGRSTSPNGPGANKRTGWGVWIMLVVGVAAISSLATIFLPKLFK